MRRYLPLTTAGDKWVLILVAHPQVVVATLALVAIVAVAAAVVAAIITVLVVQARHP